MEKRGIGFVLQHGDPAEVALKLGRRASLVVCDRGYLRPQKEWRKRVAQEARCSVIQVESDVVVPVNVASDKREFAARTLRPKLTRLWPQYLRELSRASLNKRASAWRSEVRVFRDRMVRPLLLAGNIALPKRHCSLQPVCGRD